MYILKRGGSTYQFAKANSLGKGKGRRSFPLFSTGRIKALIFNLYSSLQCLSSLIQISAQRSLALLSHQIFHFRGKGY